VPAPESFDVNLTELLSPKDVVVDLAAADKARLLRELSTRAAKAANLNENLVFAEVEKREQLGSTGIGHGIAMPHARLEGLARPVAVVARLRRPIDFDAIDSEPVDLAALVLLPTGQDGGLINVLASVARALRDQAISERARRATTSDEFYRALTGGR
jgi:PTS system nitrogen regulatory IIA component